MSVELPWEKFPGDEEDEQPPEPPQPPEEEPPQPPEEEPPQPPEEELPYQPPVDPGQPPGDPGPDIHPPSPDYPTDPIHPPAPTPDISEQVRKAVQESLSALWPTLAEQAKDYALQSVRDVVQGKEVDHTHPTITGETAKGRELVIADAKSRSIRTLFQGLAVDILFAIVAVLGTLTDFNPVEKSSWVVLGCLLIKSILTAIVSFVSRLKITPTVKVRSTSTVPSALMGQPDQVSQKQKFYVLPDLVAIPSKES